MPEEDASASDSDEDRHVLAEAAAEPPAGAEQKEEDNDEGDESDEGFPSPHLSRPLSDFP
jgi:hypothetical protein